MPNANNGSTPEIIELPESKWGKSRIVDLTPELAKALLECVPEYQRTVNEDDVLRYAADMESGEWTTSSGAITVTLRRGHFAELINGQHRCQSRLLADTAKGPIPIIFYTKKASNKGGIDGQYIVEDTGRKRSWVDYCKMKSVPNYVIMSGLVLTALMFDLNGGVAANTNRKGSNAQRWRWYEAADQDLLNEAVAVGTQAFKVGGSKSVVGALFYLACRDGVADEARTFWDQVTGQADTTHDSPAANLSQAFTQWSRYKRDGPPPNVRMNLMLVAFHQHLAGETGKNLYWRSGMGPRAVIPDWLTDPEMEHVDDKDGDLVDANA